jgi:SAM-dependent methyltransferase
MNQHDDHQHDDHQHDDHQHDDHQHDDHQHDDHQHEGQTAPEFWEDFYAAGKAPWSGNPNPLVVREAEQLPPGNALDLGCGQGDDAIWLARRGWTVTGVDIAAAALVRAAQRAEAAGVDTITWQQHDLAATFPEGSFDLVTAAYLHSPVELPRSEILRRAAAVVAPGGTLLIVGHAGFPPGSGHDHMEMPTTVEVMSDLQLDLTTTWRLDTSTVVTWTAERDGKPLTRDDNILRLTRLR